MAASLQGRPSEGCSIAAAGTSLAASRPRRAAFRRVRLRAAGHWMQQGPQRVCLAGTARPAAVPHSRQQAAAGHRTAVPWPAQPAAHFLLHSSSRACQAAQQTEQKPWPPQQQQACRHGGLAALQLIGGPLHCKRSTCTASDRPARSRRAERRRRASAPQSLDVFPVCCCALACAGLGIAQ